MRQRALVLTALLALTALAPLASAQAPTQAPSHVQIRIVPFDGPIGEDGASTLARVEYCYHAFGQLAMTATQVTLKVAEQPEWATVSVSPATLFFDVHTVPGPQMQVCSPPQKVVVQAVPNATAEGAVGNLAITATAQPNQPIAGAAAKDSIIVQAADELCHDGAHAPDEPEASSSEDAEAGDGTVTAQSAGVAPFATPLNALVVALGLAGAGTGVVTAHRRRGAK